MTVLSLYCHSLTVFLHSTGSGGILISVYINAEVLEEFVEIYDELGQGLVLAFHHVHSGKRVSDTGELHSELLTSEAVWGRWSPNVRGEDRKVERWRDVEVSSFVRAWSSSFVQLARDT